MVAKATAQRLSTAINDSRILKDILKQRGLKLGNEGLQGDLQIRKNQMIDLASGKRAFNQTITL